MPRRRLRNTRYKGLARGFYSAELGPWEAVYDPSQMLILQYEACTLRRRSSWPPPTGSSAWTTRLHRPDCRPAVNKTKVKREIDDGFTRMLVMLYEPDVFALVSRHPEIDLDLWPHFSFLANAR